MAKRRLLATQLQMPCMSLQFRTQVLYLCRAVAFPKKMLRVKGLLRKASKMPLAAKAFEPRIWSFWHDCDQMPKLVQLAVASWQHFAPGYQATACVFGPKAVQVQVLDLASFREHLETALGPEDFPNIAPRLSKALKSS